MYKCKKCESNEYVTNEKNVAANLCQHGKKEGANKKYASSSCGITFDYLGPKNVLGSQERFAKQAEQ